MATQGIFRILFSQFQMLGNSAIGYFPTEIVVENAKKDEPFSIYALNIVDTSFFTSSAKINLCVRVGPKNDIRKLYV